MKRTISGKLLFIALLVAGPVAAEETPPPVAPPAEQPQCKDRERPFDMTDVERLAKELSDKDYSPDNAGMPDPDFLGQLDYDQYRDIRYKPDKALWRDEGLPFQIQAFHRGFIFKDRVTVNIVDCLPPPEPPQEGSGDPNRKGAACTEYPKCQPTRLAYAPELFDYGKNRFPGALPPDLGFAGLRFHYPLRKDPVLDEVAVFLGASYFRAVGLGQVYGVSARGLAVDTGLPKAEEFPVFREFWIRKPAKDASALEIFALLDSPSVTGAYRFTIRPGIDTVMDVVSHLFFRKTVARLGIAPLTSMYFHGENTDRFMDDFRPEVHDSDGLLMERHDGEWLWRPLKNPRQLRMSIFTDDNPRGFGLFQRDRAFDHFQDLEAHYHLRPSAWVETRGNWGQGAVYLIEIPSDAEKYDNIVAFWSPSVPTARGSDLRYEYRLHFLLDETIGDSVGKVLATRIGASESVPSRRKFVIDFGGPGLARLSSKAKVGAEISSSVGKIHNAVVHKNEENGSWRLSFELDPESEKDLVELRALLKSGNEPLSETWVYQWDLR